MFQVGLDPQRRLGSPPQGSETIREVGGAKYNERNGWSQTPGYRLQRIRLRFASHDKPKYVLALILQNGYEPLGVRYRIEVEDGYPAPDLT